MTPIESTKLWINKMVIGLGLCPFASKVVTQKEIHFSKTKATDFKSLSALLNLNAEHILNDENKESTAIIVIEKGLESFLDYLDLIHQLEDYLEDVKLNEDIQIASFHPQYQFAETKTTDITNYTNRSPYPLIHLLKCEDVTAAIESHPDIHSVPTDNIKKLKSMSLDSLAVVYKSFK